jgi:hypothetical protein
MNKLKLNKKTKILAKRQGFFLAHDKKRVVRDIVALTQTFFIEK